MSAGELVQYLSWAVYVLIFVVVTANALRHPLRANIDIALLFTVVGGIIFISLASAPVLHLLVPSKLVSALIVSLLLAIPYMLLRLVDDFADVPLWLMPLATVSLALLVIGAFIFAPQPPPAPASPQPGWFTGIELLYLIAFLFYSVVAFIGESRKSSGVTKRRLRAAAGGSIFLCLLFLISGLNLVVPQAANVLSALSGLSGLASGISYFLGFATPGVLRRAWQEPELRAFLGRAASLPRLPNTMSIIREMEKGAATSVGAPHASIGMWDDIKGVLRFSSGEHVEEMVPTGTLTAGRAFLTQRAVFTADTQRDNPTMAETLRKYGAMAILAAPITAGENRLGVLTAYAPSAPIFADDDLALVQLLADQAAVILESRALIDEAARVQAREEVTRLKDDFLSAAAHDLKTPLTTMVAQAQLLERRAMRAPDAPADIAGIQKMVREAQRLKTLVLELLDATRAEQGKLVGQRKEVDLGALALETCARHGTDRHPCMVEAPSAALGVYDENRVQQLMENLVENAVKYSPEGGAVQINVWRDEAVNCFSVSDHGIGIPARDLPHIFERFHRGTNVDDRRFAGMGLGLFICRGIAEQHGGEISVSSTPGEGTIFKVALPVAAAVTSGAAKDVSDNAA